MKKTWLLAASFFLSGSVFAAGTYDGIWYEANGNGVYHSLHSAGNQLFDIEVEPNGSSYIGSWTSTSAFTLSGNVAYITPSSKIGGTPSCRPTGTITFNAEGTKATILVTAVDPVPGTGCDMQAGSSTTWSKLL